MLPQTSGCLGEAVGIFGFWGVGCPPSSEGGMAGTVVSHTEAGLDGWCQKTAGIYLHSLSDG